MYRIPKRAADRVVAVAVTGIFAGVAGMSSALAETDSDVQPMAAAGCSGTGCDFQDPVDTGCASSAITVDSEGTSWGTTELRYSTECQTNWVRIVGNDTNERFDFRVADHPDGPDEPAREVVWYHNGTRYGDMVYSPGNNCAIGGLWLLLGVRPLVTLES